MSNKNLKPLKAKKRCSVLNDKGERCRNLAKFKTHYNGDPEIYSWWKDNWVGWVGWVEIEVCQKHAESLK